MIQAEKEEETELLQKSQKTVKVVLECLGTISGQCDIFWELLQSLPLVDARRTHQESLARKKKLLRPRRTGEALRSHRRQWRKRLQSSKSVLAVSREEEFANVTEHAADAKTLFFVELVHADFKIDLKIGDETEKIEVIRWQFPLLHGMLRTAYSAQGLTLDGGVVLDLRRAGGLEDSDWWLAIYVMLTRGRKLENLILLGFTDQVEELLRRGPPPYLRQLTDKLEAKAALTFERLRLWPAYDGQ